MRVYNFFNYKLAEKFAWAPDHLSVQLEFVHYLCFRESTAQTEIDSYQLAQFDFTERHLLNWLPALIAGVDKLAPDSIYTRVANAVADFVASDHAWQRSTISTATSGEEQS